MPLPPQPYPSFTSVMSSAPFAPFAANDNMRPPAYRTSHHARFHPYSRAHPTPHRDRLMTAVDYRFPEPPEGPVRGLASIAPMIFPEDNEAERKSVSSTSSTESILRRQKLKTAAGRISAVIVTLRRMYRGTSVKQAEQKLQFELVN